MEHVAKNVAAALQQPAVQKAAAKTPLIRQAKAVSSNHGAAQRQLQEMADNSPAIQQFSAMQLMADTGIAQRKQATGHTSTLQRKANSTGLPDNLKSGIENLGGYAMDDVKVHYNSSKPANLNALAYAQGTDIHVAPGQEKHLPHEAWHVVQQKQGRVQPTLQMKGIGVNDDTGLESEADVMGAKAVQLAGGPALGQKIPERENPVAGTNTVQRAVGFEYELDSSNVSSRRTKAKTKTFGIFGSEEPSRPLVDLKKGDVIADFGTFDVSVDSTPEGFDVEIRIKEVDHMSTSSLVGLKNTVQQVLGLLNYLGRQRGPVPASKIGGSPNIILSGDFSSGSLQATTGLSLTALHAFLSGEMGNLHEDRQKRLMHIDGPNHRHTEDQSVRALYTRSFGKGSPALLQQSMDNTRIFFPNLPEPAQMQLAAVVTSILTIPATARVTRLPYAKSATTLLARSDYATVFNELPAVVLMNKDKLKSVLMNTLNGYLASYMIDGVNANSPIYPPGSIKDSAGLSLTLGEWFGGLLPPAGSVRDTQVAKDLLSDSNYPKGTHSHDDMSQLESLGGYGAKTDPGEGGKRLPIFEFRKYLKVPDDHLLLVVEGIWELVHKANQRK